jgi:hypothetical protein
MNMSDIIKYGEISHQIDETLKEFGYKTDNVAAMIYGVRCHLTENEVRALQVMAKRAAEKSEEDFLEFRKNVIVYSCNDYSDKKCHQMFFREDGRFSNEFNPGFYDVSSNLAFELF